LRLALNDGIIPGRALTPLTSLSGHSPFAKEENMSPVHSFHMVVSDLMDEARFPGCHVLKAAECGGTHNLPLFYTAHKSNATEFCDVDMLILKGGRIRVIVEIEEVVHDPGLLFGKFVAPAVCWGYIHDPTGQDAPMDDRVTFIEIVSAERIQPNSSKPEQWRLVEKAIRELMPLRGKGARMAEYHLLSSTVNEFRSTAGQALVQLVQDAVAG
jgi:hypothetical protein